MTTMTPEKMQSIIEAALMVAGHPLTIASIQNIFPEEEKPDSAAIKTLLSAINERHADSGIEVKEVGNGYRFQAKADFSPWLSRLWEERAPRYSRAFLETLVIIAYKQPITRAEIEDIRGVTVSTHIIKTLMEREWIRVIGYREIPGRPGIYGTTKEFLDYFNLKSLSELPTLAELKSLEAQEAKLQVQLALEDSHIGPANSDVIPEERDVVVAAEEIEGIEVSDTIEITESEENNVIAFSESIEITMDEDESDSDNDIDDHDSEDAVQNASS